MMLRRGVFSFVGKLGRALRANAPVRPFASDSERPEVLSCKEAAARLSKVLSVEYGHEQEFLKEVYTSQEELSRLGFVRKDPEDSAQIVIARKMNGKEIEIKYAAKDQEIVPEAEAEEAEVENALIVPLQITIRGRNGAGLFFDCESSRRELTVYRVTTLEDHTRYKELLTSEERDREYLGPCFLNLGEKMQRGFYNLLESMGVNEDLLEYVEKSAAEKEQNLYLKWMSKVDDIVKNIC